MSNYLNIFIFLAEQWAMPVTLAIVVLIILIFAVRPFFALLFSKDRLDALQAAKDAVAKKEQENIFVDNAGAEKIPGEAHAQGVDGEVKDQNKGVVSSQEKINKLAESNPERAGDLVKQWLHQGEK